MTIIKTWGRAKVVASLPDSTIGSGTKVVHKAFGPGRVTEIDGLIATVRFGRALKFIHVDFLKPRSEVRANS
jgi:hypothetical protein